MSERTQNLDRRAGRLRLPVAHCRWSRARPLLTRPLCAALLLLGSACTSVPDPARPWLSALRLVDGYGGQRAMRLRLTPSTDLRLVAQQGDPEPLARGALTGLGRVFPRVRAQSPAAALAEQSPGIAIVIGLEASAAAAAENGGVALLPGQFGIGPTGDLELQVTCVDRLTGQVVDNTRLTLKRRWLDSPTDLEAPIAALFERYAKQLISG